MNILDFLSRPEILPVIGTLGGTLLGVLSTLGGLWIKHKYESKNEMRRIILESAIANWKEAIGIAKHNSIDNSKDTKVWPLDTFIIQMYKIIASLEKGKLDKDKIRQILQEKKEIQEVYRYQKNGD